MIPYQKLAIDLLLHLNLEKDRVFYFKEYARMCYEVFGEEFKAVELAEALIKEFEAAKASKG